MRADGGVPDPEDLAGCARWPPGRRSAAGSGSRRRSARGACPAARPAPCPAGRPTRRRPTARPGGSSSPCPRRRPSRRGPARRTPRCTAAPTASVSTNSWIAPVRSRSVANVRPPWRRIRASRPATRTRSGVRVPGGRSGCLSRTWLQRVVGRVAVGLVEDALVVKLVQPPKPVRALLGEMVGRPGVRSVTPHRRTRPGAGRRGVWRGGS